MAGATNPTNQPQQAPVITKPGGQVLAPAGGVVPKKHNQDMIRERRETIASLLDKGMTSPSKLAKALGVSDETVRRDLKAIRQDRKAGIQKKAGPEQAVDIIGRFDEIARTSMADYIAIKDNSPRANQVKATLLSTSLRATIEKANFLITTGVIPPNLSEVDKQMDNAQQEERIKGRFEPEVAKVITNSESRRKVLDIVEKLKAAPPEMAAAFVQALDDADNEQLPPELPDEPDEKEAEPA